MISDIIFFLVSVFVLEPFQVDIVERLGAVQAPREVITQVTDCATTAAPILFDRVSEDPWWGFSTAVGVALGATAPEAILVDVTPSCSAALDLARPHLQQAES